jgi:RNA polymerase sigma-70 factor (ECF subfamily)
MRYQVQAVRTAYLITADRGIAEDVVQAAFVRVYERIHQFDSQRTFAPWFMRIVANEALQAVRQSKRQVSLEGEDGEIDFTDLLPDTSPDAEIEAALESAQDGDALREAVKEALKALSPEQRTVIVLRYYLGLSENELADQLNSPPGTIKWRLHAARKQLRVLLRQFWQSHIVEREA